MSWKKYYTKKSLRHISTAFLHNTNDGEKTYIAEVSDGKSVFFRIPKSEVTDEFKDEVPAQLLIRWIEH